MPISTIEEAIEEIRQGRMVILVDDPDRENEGDLTMAAEKVTPEAINFMARYGRGLICLSLSEEKAAALELPLMARSNTSPYGTAFTVSIDARQGIASGISPADRARTILTAVTDHAAPQDLVRPGHIFPLIARRGGVLVRTGQTEGSVDLARLADLSPAGVICEIMNEDGTMARMPELEVFAGEHGLKLVTIADLIRYRMRTERLVRRIAETTIPTKWGGEFQTIVYENDVDANHHLAMVKGVIPPGGEVLVRVHSQCLTGDVFGSLRCDCGDQLHRAMQIVNREGRGVILYLHQEGRGIGLLHKIRAYALQDEGLDTVEANEELGFKPDLRDYGIGAQILVDLGVRRMRLLTNNPTKIVGLEGYGLQVSERVPLQITPHEGNIRYLRTKQQKLGHLLNLE
ncbi:MAG: bifunctional 3,4-dihydroxy-2-butanone-4-phosphate synthase/GTP cyclohydrolase II [Deltaproteobacteria bacterium]|nr:bifunctional 3,4-dihydroxy-2-butanone-4-phosphate synthase/GTP cyclohydrolase II [Deltaproteobacteria bacterium]MBI3078493.1 bifunctional 3,4-dihydroxy-2-butanone-4-phosphate synthase/GTP cyclohydrolase II [Deltaproteobacteria bacterium]